MIAELATAVGHRGRHDRRPGGRSGRRRQAARPRRCSNPSIAPRPARCCAPACAWAPSTRARATRNTQALSCYGEHIGLAFQIVDDILDVEESSEALGKTAGKDAAQHKITFPAVYGLEESRRMADDECAARPRGAGAVRRARRAAARAGRPDRPPQVMKPRLDRLLVERGWRRVARKGAGADHGRRGAGGRPARPPNPASRWMPRAALEVLAQPPFVGRGGLKLDAALAHFGIDVAGRVCLDIGSSTGGFTDCLLQARRGARARGGCGRGPARLETAQRSARGGA